MEYLDNSINKRDPDCNPKHPAGWKTTWKVLIDIARADDVIIYCTLTEEELHQEFDDGFGCDYPTELSFTAWSENYVYFPATYDGCLWVARVPRNVCDVKVKPIGR